MPTVLPVPGRLSPSLTVSIESFSVPIPKLRLPFERNFRDRCIWISSVIDRFYHQPHPTRSDRSDIDFLAFHSIVEIQFTRAAVRKLHCDCRQPIVLRPDVRALEIARLNQDAM